MKAEEKKRNLIHISNSGKVISTEVYLHFGMRFNALVCSKHTLSLSRGCAAALTKLLPNFSYFSSHKISVSRWNACATFFIHGRTQYHIFDFVMVLLLPPSSHHLSAVDRRVEWQQYNSPNCTENMIPVKIREKNEMHEGVDNLHQVF